MKKKAAEQGGPVAFKPRSGGSVTLDGNGKEIKRARPTLPLDHPDHARQRAESTVAPGVKATGKGAENG